MPHLGFVSTISPAVLKLQQQLSEKFSIPTFDITGGISTVPTLTPIGNINVDVGGFGGETIGSFTGGLNQIIGALKVSGGKIGSTTFKAAAVGQNPDPNETNAEEENGDVGGFDFSQTLNEGFGSVSELLSKNPTILIVGLGLLAFTVFKR